MPLLRRSGICGLAIALAVPAHVSAKYADAVDALDAALPDVDAVFASANETMRDFTVQAELMKKQVAEREKEENAKLLARKEKYEAALVASKQEMATVEASNEALQGVLKSLERGNDLLKEDANRMRNSNHLMRIALSSLGPKMKTAKEFLSESTRVAEEQARAQELQMLEPKASPPTLENFLSITREEVASARSASAPAKPAVASAIGAQGEKAANLASRKETVADPKPPIAAAVPPPSKADAPVETKKAHQPEVSLLAVENAAHPVGTQDALFPHLKDYSPSKTPQESPEALIDALPRRLEDLSLAQKEGEVELEAHYLALKEVDDKRKGELEAIRQDLETRRSSLVDEQIKLHAAKQHLIMVGKDLQERLRGIRVFAQKAGDSVADAIKAADAAAGDAA